MIDLVEGEDRRSRCSWCDGDAVYQDYHDREWGFPVTDDQRLFEKISLEGFQAGLSWLTILRKRENFRKAFVGFDYHQIALFGEQDVLRLLGDQGIVRHKGKINAVINNACRAIELVKEFGSLAAYFWRYQASPEGFRSDSPESKAMSRDLKKRGFTFVGPTICYAFMQAMGLVNDHLPGCWVWPEVERAKTQLDARLSEATL